MASPAHRLRRIVIVNAVIAAAITVAFANWSARTTLRYVVEQFAVTLLITACISPACMLVLRRVTRPVFSRFSFPANWTILIVIMAAIAALGSLVAVVVLAMVGYLPPGEILQSWLHSALKVSLIVTVSVGVFFTSREMLRSRLNKVTLALRTKERDEAEARRLATEARLASLESRVHPHFLFNTLNSIAALIPQDPAGAERMTGQLASLLRSALDSAATPLVPLEQELKVVTDYLEIERVRFGDRLQYRVDAPSELNESLVPRLSLQTLVENSVKYAVSPNRTGGVIEVRARAHNQRLVLEVADDGPGFELATAQPGHGLALLNERLRMAFADAATLTVSHDGGRAVVRVELPSKV